MRGDGRRPCSWSPLQPTSTSPGHSPLAADSGVGNDPRYNKTRCFETFLFPTPPPAQQTRIGELAEQFDAHRKRQQAALRGLTLTGTSTCSKTACVGEA